MVYDNMIVHELLGSHILLQEKLLNPENASFKPEEDFLKSFAGVVGLNWASLLSLTSDEIEEVKQNEEGFSQRDYTFHMLKKWATKEDATYSQLLQKLRAISLFQYAKQ